MNDVSLPVGLIEPRSADELAGVVPAAAIASDPAYHWITYLDALPTYDEIRGESDPIARVKLFAPAGPGTWWIASYDSDLRMAWGAARITELVIGPISISELTSIRIPAIGLPIERDLNWKPQALKAIAWEYGR